MGYELFVDASFKPHGRRIGWGIVIVYNGKIIDIISKEKRASRTGFTQDGYIQDSTRAELLGIVDVIGYCNENYDDINVNIYNDSDSLCRVFQGETFFAWELYGEIDDRANGDLWKKVVDIWDGKRLKITRYPPEKKRYHDLAHFLSRHKSVKAFGDMGWLIKNSECPIL